MKAKITLLLIVCLALTSCSKWYYWHKHHQDDDDGGGNEERQTVEISDTQIIVRFEPDADKEGIRAEFGIEEGEYELCSCGDPNLELWGIDPADISIEGAISALKGKSKAEGDFQFTFSTPPVTSYETIGFPQIDPGIANPSFDADKVDIAVLDTGIDYGQSFVEDPLANPYLYSTGGLSDCPFQVAGWNFADPVNGANVLDDNGHGTFVTKIITSTLEDKGVGYRILPVKVFNGDGEGSYWNVVCAFGYLQKVRAELGNLDIVNASFGGTIEDQLFDDKGLLNTMIEELGDAGVLVVTSAGNEGIDTDNGPLKHFPSGYAADNILGVGGYEIDGSGDVVIYTGFPGSNYGMLSIDLAAPFEGWNVQLDLQPDANLMGTSYSAAYVTGLTSAYFIDKGRPGPVELKINFLNDMDVTKVSDPLKPDINEGRYVE